jgi:NAD+ kinase
MNLSKVLVVHKRTDYEVFCEQERDPRILHLVSENHFTIQDLRRSHSEHRETMERIGAAIESLSLQATFIRRSEIREAAYHDYGLVLTVGGDGTFLETSHFVRETPMLGVNSAPSVSTGVLCAATGKTVEKILLGIRRGSIKAVTLNRLGLSLNNSVVAEPILNEVLVAAQNPALTSRYIMELGKRREDQRSSGVYIGTAAGSTAVMRSAGAKILPLQSRQIQYLVREPHRGPGKSLKQIRGTIAPRIPLRLHSKMRGGMIFIDGIHVRYRFDYGDALEILPQATPLTVYGLASKRRV